MFPKRYRKAIAVGLHGFDANGVKYDEAGAYNDKWWSEADQKAFVERSAKVASFNDGYMAGRGRIQP